MLLRGLLREEKSDNPDHLADLSLDPAPTLDDQAAGVVGPGGLGVALELLGALKRFEAALVPALPYSDGSETANDSR